MAVDIGSAVGYLDLDISGFLAGLKSAQSEAEVSTRKLEAIGNKFVSIGDKIAGVGTKLTTAITAPLAGGVGAAVKHYANMEQAIGGVETLFKGSADTVIKNSETAYFRAGTSATDYMEQVTSFSARLLQSTGGDTEEAARIADMAMVDMADNANKFGTNISSIQDAYQGFAKENYTMLDNLKLGYGGTKTEMERLLDDAEKLTGVKYDISNLDDVYTAIHVVQEELGVVGTTALEATETISGSFGMAKTSISDFLANLGKPGADMEQFKNNMIESVTIFVNNIKNVLATIWENIPLEGWQKNLIAAAAAAGPFLLVVGKLTSGIGKIIDIFIKIPAVISRAKAAFTAVSAAIGGISAPVVAVVTVIGVLVAAFVNLWKTNEKFRNNITAIWDGIKAKFEAFGQGIVDRLNALGFDFENFTQVVKAIWDGFCAVLAPVFEGVFNTISIVIGTVLDVITGILDVFIGLFTGNWDQCWNGIKGIFEAVWNGIKDFFTNILNVIKGVFDVVLGWFGTSWDACWNGIKSFFEGIWNGIVSFFTGILTGIQTAFTTVFTAMSTFFTTIWTNIKSFFEGIWNGIVSFLTGAWETIKNIVTVGIMFIAEFFSAAFELITAPFRFIWENCKTTIMTIWNAIKTTITNALTAIQTVITNVWNAVKTFFTTVWTAISTFVMNIWNTIKTNVTNAINAVKTVITNVFNAVKTTVTNIWNAIKTTITNVWNAIKTTIITIVNAIKTTITNVWNAIKTTITNVVNGIKSTVSSVFNAVKSTISSVFNSIKSTVTSVWNGIKNAITTPINAAKSAVSSVVNSIKSTISSGFNAAKNTVSNVFNSIKNSISNVMNSAKNAVSNAISNIKSKFNFNWSLPKLKMPHLKISGKFSLSPPSVPSFSIDWYKKAMNNAMILNDATIFGAKDGKLLGGGEAGSEVVSGADTLMKMIREAVASVFVNMTKTIQTYFDMILLNIRQSNMTLVESVAKFVDISNQFVQASEQLGYVTYNGFSKAREVIEKSNDKPGTGGGDTFIFNSPKAIDEIEAAKQMKQAKRDLAEGF